MLVTSKPRDVNNSQEENKNTELNTPSSRVATVIAWCNSNWRAILSELVATTLYVFVACMSCIPAEGQDYQPVLNTALGSGLIVMINIQTFMHISGAHMNPCITLLAVLWGKVSIVLGIAYCIVQCVASVFALWLLHSISPVDLAIKTVCVTQPRPGLGVWESIIVEMVLTTALIWITCAIWDPVNRKKQDSTPVKFGLTIAGLIMAGGSLTGASMNPARSLGPAVLTGIWTAHWVYWVGPFFGTSLAGISYIFIWLDRKYNDHNK